MRMRGCSSRHFAERAQLGARIGGTGGIARAVEQQEPRLRRDGGGELARGDLVALVRTGEGHHRRGIRQHHHVGVGDPVGRRDDCLVARVEHRHAQVVDGLLRAGGDQDLAALVLERIVAAELADDGVFQLVDAVHIGVACEAAADRIDAGLRDVRGVSKSGSPAPRPMMSLPSALSFAARAVTASVGDGLTRCTRRETGWVTRLPDGLDCARARLYYGMRT